MLEKYPDSKNEEKTLAGFYKEQASYSGGKGRLEMNFRCTTLEAKRWWLAGCQWLTPIILSSCKAEIRRITVQSQPG
jgi:hypothetical protein